MGDQKHIYLSLEIISNLRDMKFSTLEALDAIYLATGVVKKKTEIMG